MLALKNRSKLILLIRHPRVLFAVLACAQKNVVAIIAIITFPL